MILSPDQAAALSRSLHERLAEDGHALPAAPWPVIGAGLRGPVFDLGDGSVLKTVGQGRALGGAEGAFRREVLALTHLQDTALPASLRAPRLHAHGPLRGVSGPHGPLGHWLRMERLSGLPLSHPQALARRSADEMGEELGAALAGLHALPLPDPAPGDPLQRFLQLARPRLSAPELLAMADLIGKGLEEETAAPVFLHSDLHLENVVYDPEVGFGLLDWAECGLGWGEAEWRHFEIRPDWRDAIFRGYKAGGGALERRRYYLGAAVDALTSYAIEASTHIRTAQRLRGLLEHCLHQAGIETA